MKNLLVFMVIAFGYSMVSASSPELEVALNKVAIEQVSFCQLNTQRRSNDGVPVNITCDGKEFFAASVNADNEPTIMTAISSNFLRRGFKILSCAPQEIHGIGGSTYVSGNICFFIGSFY